MRHKDMDLMLNIRQFAEGFYFREGRSPSTTEIGNAVGIARGTAYRYLVEMNERGLIQYDGRELMTEKIRRVSPYQSVEVYSGSIPCGPLDEVEAAVEEYVPLPTSIFGDGELYIIRATGESMINAGIDSGDLVVIQKQETASIGDIVVALHENANTLKRLGYDTQRNCHLLIPENDTMEPILVDHVVIQGVAKFIIKAL